jgi:hypothetical protein
MRSSPWWPVFAVVLAVVTGGVLVVGSTAGGAQTPCQALRSLELALQEFRNIDLDDTSDAALSGAVAAAGSAARDLAVATKTSATPEFKALEAKIEALARSLSTVGDDRSVSGDRALIQSARSGLVQEIEMYAHSLSLSC